MLQYLKATTTADDFRKNVKDVLYCSIHCKLMMYVLARMIIMRTGNMNAPQCS